MRLLELFSGTQSIGKVARELGFEVVCLDRDMEADIKCDIWIGITTFTSLVPLM